MPLGVLGPVLSIQNTADLSLHQIGKGHPSCRSGSGNSSFVGIVGVWPTNEHLKGLLICALSELVLAAHREI